MTWTVLIWVALYFAFGWILTDICEVEDDASKITIFIAWPIIFAAFFIAATLVLTFGLIYLLANLFCILIHKGD